MIMLPRYPPPRTWLQSFWITLSLAAGSILGTFCALVIAPRWSVSGMVFALLMAVPGSLRPRIASRPYRLWNLLARRFVRLARFWVTGVCFYIICTSVGLTGSRARLAQPAANETLWVARTASTPTTDVHHHNGAPPEFAQKGWIRAYFTWAQQSGNLWALCLLPFLIILSALENDQAQNPVAANVYTLF
jgi:hypothetical protein